MWADLGQAAQAQTTSKKEVKSVAAKNHKSPKKIANNVQARLSSKKTKGSKKKIKAKHELTGDGNKNHKKTVHAKNTKKIKAHKRNYTQSSSSHTDLKPAPDYELPTMQPSDLWLAKDSPDIYKKLMYEGQLDERTLKILESAYSYLGTPYRWGERRREDLIVPGSLGMCSTRMVYHWAGHHKYRHKKGNQSVCLI